MNDVKLDDKQNQDDYEDQHNKQPSEFGRRRGESSSFRGDRGFPKVFKNQNFKRSRGGYQ